MPLLPGHLTENNPYTGYHLPCGSAEYERSNESKEDGVMLQVESSKIR